MKKLSSKAAVAAFDSWFGDTFDSSSLSSKIKASDRLKQAQRKVDYGKKKKIRSAVHSTNKNIKKKKKKKPITKNKKQNPKAFKRLQHALKSQICPGIFCLQNDERRTTYVIKLKQIYRLKARREGRRELSATERRRMYDDAHVCKACYDGYTKLVLMDESMTENVPKNRLRVVKLENETPPEEELSEEVKKKKKKKFAKSEKDIWSSLENALYSTKDNQEKLDLLIEITDAKLRHDLESKKKKKKTTTPTTSTKICPHPLMLEQVRDMELEDHESSKIKKKMLLKLLQSGVSKESLEEVRKLYPALKRAVEEEVKKAEPEIPCSPDDDDDEAAVMPFVESPKVAHTSSCDMFRPSIFLPKYCEYCSFPEADHHFVKDDDDDGGGCSGDDTITTPTKQKDAAAVSELSKSLNAKLEAIFQCE